MIVSADGKKSLSNKPELPIDGLPESTQEYIGAVCNIYHCPREFVIVSVLATSSAAVGKKLKINEGKYKNLAVLWFVLVARSGSNKSYPTKLVSEPLRKIDGELFDAYKVKYDEWKDTKVGVEPRCPGIVLDDCTDERRSEILFLNGNDGDGKRGAIGIYPELKGMFDSKNQYQSGGTTAISKLLRLYDGDDIKVDRRNAGTMLIREPFFSMIGDLQTGMLRATFGSELFMTNGLNQRFLFCVAEDIEYPKRNNDILPTEIKDKWADTVNALYRNYRTAPDGYTYTLFHGSEFTVSLSPEADKLYEEYFNTLQEKKEQAETDYEASIYSKLQIQVLRFAGVVHALELAEECGLRQDSQYIRASTMEYAIRCMEYFEYMAKLVEKKISEPATPRLDQTNRPQILRAFMRAYPEVTQGELARLIKVSAPYISKVKYGQSG